jgi:integrase
MIDYLRQLNIENASPEYYLFGQDMQPSNKRQNVRDTGRRWSHLRRKLNLPQEMQMYSLRDSSITESLSNNMPANVVRDYARHHSLEMTQIYSSHENPLLRENINKYATEF